MSDLIPLPDPQFKFFADLRVEVGPPQEVGHTVHGLRRLIPILGGTATGDGWSARVLPGGADFQLIVNDRLSELDARYVLETDGGDLIYVQNRAVRSGPARSNKASFISSSRQLVVRTRNMCRPMATESATVQGRGVRRSRPNSTGRRPEWPRRNSLTPRA